MHYVLRRGRRSQAVHRGVAAVKHVRPLAAGSAHPAWTARDRATSGCLRRSTRGSQPHAGRSAARATSARAVRTRPLAPSGGTPKEAQMRGAVVPAGRRGARAPGHAPPAPTRQRERLSSRATVLHTLGQRGLLKLHPGYNDCFFRIARMRFLLV